MRSCHVGWISVDLNQGTKREKHNVLYLTLIRGVSLCRPALGFPGQPFIRSTLHLAGVFLRTRGSRVVIVKLSGWAYLEKAIPEPKQSVLFPTGPFWKGPFWTGPAKNTTVHPSMFLLDLELNRGVILQKWLKKRIPYPTFKSLVHIQIVMRCVCNVSYRNCVHAICNLGGCVHIVFKTSR